MGSDLIAGLRTSANARIAYDIVGISERVDDLLFHS